MFRNTLYCLGALAAITLAMAIDTHATTPSLVNYQGVLTNPTGDPLEGTLTVTFSIYDDAAATNPALWSESQSITTDPEGRFNVLLGSSSALMDAAFSGPDRWLGTRVNPELTDLLPRTRITTVAYAFRAATIDGASGGNITSEVSIGPGHTNTGLHAFSAGESNVTSGNYSSASGGRSNSAVGYGSHVGAGSFNLADGLLSTVSGGLTNRAQGDYSFVGGGGGPIANDSNIARTEGSAVVGGRQNRAERLMSFVGGGLSNTANGTTSAIGGGEDNYTSGLGATVAGGIADTAGGNWATVSGGDKNRAMAPYAVVSGGSSNRASGNNSVIIGGTLNFAAALHAVVLGGSNNQANGNYSYAGGQNANANHLSSFVWSDNSPGGLSSSADYEFSVRASGGTRIFSNSAKTTGVVLAAGGGAWAAACDRNVKENIEPVDNEKILSLLATLPIAEWNYISQEKDVRHIGPMAQDFYAAFGVGEDDKHITTIDADGVALAAIQALYQKQRDENRELREQIAELREMIRAQATQPK